MVKFTDNFEKLYRQNPDLKIASIKTKEMQEVVKMSIANDNIKASVY